MTQIRQKQGTHETHLWSIFFGERTHVLVERTAIEKWPTATHSWPAFETLPHAAKSDGDRRLPPHQHPEVDRRVPELENR